MRYRKKPVVVDAYKWNVNSESDGPPWFCDAIKDGRVRLDYIRNCLWIATLEGEHMATPGDYIICGVKGELYPCKPDIFEMTYEEVE